MKNRPRQALINAVICENISVVHYVDESSGFKDPPTFGIWEFMDPGYRSVWHKGVEKPPDSSRMLCMPMGLVMNVLRIRHINFFSLDVEGGELQVLKSIDFDSITFDVLVLEDNNSRELITALLTSKGYDFVEKDTVHGQLWFKRKEYKARAAPAGVEVTRIS